MADRLRTGPGNRKTARKICVGSTSLAPIGVWPCIQMKKVVFSKRPFELGEAETLPSKSIIQESKHFLRRSGNKRDVC